MNHFTPSSSESRPHGHYKSMTTSQTCQREQIIMVLLPDRQWSLRKLITNLVLKEMRVLREGARDPPPLPPETEKNALFCASLITKEGNKNRLKFTHNHRQPLFCANRF